MELLNGGIYLPGEESDMDYSDYDDESWETLFGRVKQVRQKTFEQRQKVLADLNQKAAHVRNEMQQPVYIKFKDKIFFSAGVLNFGLSCGVLAGYPSAYPEFYTAQMIILLPLRLFEYRRQKWGYFLLDFCYYANLLLLLYLWVWPNNATLFQICYSFANGPVGVAIIAWRNSLVFHSLDKLTSLTIHMSPAIVTSLLRHHIVTDNRASKYVTADVHQGFLMQVYHQFWVPVAFYCLWQTLYFVKVQVFDKAKIERRNRSAEPLKYITSYTELKKRPGPMQKIITSVPKQFRPFMFGVVQLGFTMLTMLPVLVLWHLKYLNLAWLVFLLSWSTWNGANFYVEVFAARYVEQLAQLEKELKEKGTLKIDPRATPRAGATGETPRVSETPRVGETPRSADVPRVVPTTRIGNVIAEEEETPLAKASKTSKKAA